MAASTRQRCVAVLRQHARDAELIDMAALARQTGTAVSAVLFGAIAASGMLPFPRAAYEDTIRRAGKGVEASLRGFAAAFDAIRKRREQHEALLGAAAGAGTAASRPALDDDLRQRFPTPVHDMLALGHARLVEYQDRRYAALYADRLQRVLRSRACRRPRAAPVHARTTRETARWLALWMAFDDIVRVAELKLRASRGRSACGARWRRATATSSRSTTISSPACPSSPRCCRASLAARLSAWDARRRARGVEPWALPLKVGAHTVGGALALWVLAGMKGQRRRGSRFAAEQALIERWLAASSAARASTPRSASRSRSCGRLIKGYGATNERGKQHLLHVVDHLAVGTRARRARADAVRAAREAALADESGSALDRTMVAHGAPVRPVREQPIRWYRRPPPAQRTT